MRGRAKIARGETVRAISPHHENDPVLNYLKWDVVIYDADGLLRRDALRA